MAEMVIKYLSSIAAILGLVQGFAWFILSLLVILLYSGGWDSNPCKTLTVENIYSCILYNMYFVKQSKEESDGVSVLVTRTTILIFAILYIILSIIWIGLTIKLLVDKKVDTNKVRKTFLYLGILICIISLEDFILVCLLGHDYGKYTHLLPKESTISSIYTLSPIVTSIGIAMTIAARGFILWILNVSIAVSMIILSRFTLTNNDVHNDSLRGYHTSSPVQEGIPNKGFSWDREPPNYIQNNPRGPSPHGFNSSGNASRPQQALHNERVAKIGKPPTRSPPHNVPPARVPYKGRSPSPQGDRSYVYPTNPRVPSPDYSPPNSPMQTQLKSALKNRNMNAYGNNDKYY